MVGCGGLSGGGECKHPMHPPQHSDCGYVKALGEFYPLTMEDGTAHLSTRCIDCIRTHAQAWFDEQAHTGNTKVGVGVRRQLQTG